MKKILILSIIFISLGGGLVFAADEAEKQEENISLPDLITYIDSPVVEQRQVFTAEEIQAMHIQDLPSLMEAAGIQILSYGPYGLEQKPSIRGFTDETVRVVINGICVNNAQYGTFDFSSLNIEDIEKIEVVRGGFTESVSDEGAVGGAIYITTKKQSLGQHFSFDSLVKSYFNLNCPFDTFSQTAGYNGQTGENSFLKAAIKGTFANNKYLFKNYRNLLTQRENAQVMDGNASVNFEHFFGKGNFFNISDIFYIGDKSIPGAAYGSNPGIQKDFDNNFTFGLTNPQIAKGLQLSNLLNYQSNTRFYDDTASSSKHYVNSVKYSGTADYYALSWFKEALGLTVDYTYLDSTNDGVHQQLSGTLKSTSKFYFGNFRIIVPIAAKSCNKNFAFTPKLGFGYEWDYIDVFLDGYRMVQFPNMDDLYWEGSGSTGNPDLIPESGWGGDFTINGHNIWLPFSLCVFSNYYENKIKWSDESGCWRPENVASAFYLGVDCSFEKDFLNRQLVVKGNGEYLYTRLLDKNNASEYGNKIMWTPDFTASLSTSYNYPGSKNFPETSVTLQANYIGKRYVSNLNQAYMKPYLLVNLSGDMKFNFKNWKITPYFRLDNLLNWSYESVENYPMPGISVSAGVKFSK